MLVGVIVIVITTIAIYTSYKYIVQYNLYRPPDAPWHCNCSIIQVVARVVHQQKEYDVHDNRLRTASDLTLSSLFTTLIVVHIVFRSLDFYKMFVIANTCVYVYVYLVLLFTGHFLTALYKQLFVCGKNVL